MLKRRKNSLDLSQEHPSVREKAGMRVWLRAFAVVAAAATAAAVPAVRAETGHKSRQGPPFRSLAPCPDPRPLSE